MTNGPLCSAEELERPIRSVMPMPGSRSHLDPAMQWMRGMISYAVKETLSGGHVVHPEEGR